MQTIVHHFTSAAAYALMWSLLLLSCVTPGCSGMNFETTEQKAARATTDVVKTVASKLAESTAVTSSELEAGGEIADPEYHVDAVWVTGLQTTIRMRGLRLNGHLAGRGTGPTTQAEFVPTEADARTPATEPSPSP